MPVLGTGDSEFESRRPDDVCLVVFEKMSKILPANIAGLLLWATVTLTTARSVFGVNMLMLTRGIGPKRVKG